MTRLLAPAAAAIASILVLAMVPPEGAGPSAASARGSAPAEERDARKVRALLVTGDDVPAHDWRATTPVTRAALEADERLEVRVCEDPAILETRTLESYDVVVLNYRDGPGRRPSPAAREKLAGFVRRGGGLAVLHFGVAAFADWEEYVEIVGRIWVGRRNGEKLSGHSPRGPFSVRVVAPDHPVTRGIEDFEADDELYSKLVGEGEIDVLLSARSDFSGRDEPLAWTRAYGEGRVFVTVLGHDVRARENAAFRTLLRQGVAWAAD